MDDDTQTEIDRIDGNISGLHARISDLQDEIEELRKENRDLWRRLDQMAEVVNPDPEQVSDDLSRGKKVHKIRKALIRKALDGNGRADMKYDAVRALFDNAIAASYSYDLMKDASEMKGFAYGNSGPNSEGQKRIRVEMASVNDKSLIQSVKKAKQENPA